MPDNSSCGTGNLQMRLNKKRGTIRKKQVKNLLLEEEAPVALPGCGSPRRTGESDRHGPKKRPCIILYYLNNIEENNLKV
jgi:hypothetical protein